MKAMVCDTFIEVNVKRANLRKIAAERCNIAEEAVSENLVMYDYKTNTVTVDFLASKFYEKYASLHECICCGEYQDLAPKVLRPEQRCGQIDLMLLDLMSSPIEKLDYVTRRIEMFEALIELNLSPKMNSHFEEAINMLTFFKCFCLSSA